MSRDGEFWCKVCTKYRDDDYQSADDENLCISCFEYLYGDKDNAEKHESLQLNEENVRPEKSEASLLCLSRKGESEGTGSKEEAKKEMRKLTQLVKKEVGNVIGEWRDSLADISAEDIYNEFQKRSIAAMGIDMPLIQFQNLFEIIRYEEIPDIKTH